MPGWNAAMLIAAVVLVSCGTWVLARAAYRRQRLVLAVGALSWAGGIVALAASLPLP